MRIPSPRRGAVSYLVELRCWAEPPGGRVLHGQHLRESPRRAMWSPRALTCIGIARQRHKLHSFVLVSSAWTSPQAEERRTSFPRPRTVSTIRISTRRYSFQVDREANPTYPLGLAVGSPRVAVDIAQHLIGAEIMECVIAIFVDSRQRASGYAEIARGTVNAARLSPRDVLVPALHSGCPAIVLAHNHPTQDPTPSPTDRSMTAALRDACTIVGLRLLDHLIVTRSEYFSFRESENWT